MTVTAQFSDVSRRGLLTGALAGGFLLAFHLPVRAVNEPVEPPDSTDGKFAPNALIRIDEAGHVTLVMPQVEMGQGVYTAIAMILADELDADIAQVTLEHAPPNDKLYGNPLFGLQVTGNSNSIRSWWDKLRAAGAGARHAGAGRGEAMAGRSRKLHHLEERGHAQGQRPKALLWRARLGCEQRNAAQGCGGEKTGGFRLYRPALEALRHA